MLGDKAYFVIVGCPLGVNRGVARDGLGKVKLCVVSVIRIPADECITLCRQLSGVVGGSVILNILAGGCVAVFGYELDRVLVDVPLGNQIQHIGGFGGVGVKIKFFIAVVPACKGVVFFGGSSGFRKLSAAVNGLGGSKRCAVRRKSSFQHGADEIIFQYVVVAALGNGVPLRFGTGIGYSHRARTASKSIVSNESDRDRNTDGFEISAIVKSSRLNRAQRGWESDTFQTCTTIKGGETNKRNRIRN